MAVSIEQVEKAFTDFQKEHNNNVSVELVFVNKPKDLYGTKITDRDNDEFQGAYYPARREIVIFGANIANYKDLTKTLSHELRGHWGLNTLYPIEKRHLLTSILDNSNEPTLADIWARVNNSYPNIPDLKKAEEVFAFIAEDRHLKKNRSNESHLDLTPTNKKLEITYQSLANISDAINNGVREGSRQQQIFPENDQAQFSIKNINLPIGTKMSAADWKEAVALVGSEQIALPKQNGEYAGKVILVTDTHLVQLTGKHTAIAHDISKLANAKDIEQLADTGQLQGKHFMLKYDQVKGMATALKITTPQSLITNEFSPTQLKSKGF